MHRLWLRHGFVGATVIFVVGSLDWVEEIPPARLSHSYCGLGLRSGRGENSARSSRGSRLLWVDDTLTVCQPSVGQVVQINSVSGHVQKLLAGGQRAGPSKR